MLMNQMTQMNQAQLLHWINMVSFAVVDIAEYLDTHPIDAEAICYFNHHRMISVCQIGEINDEQCDLTESRLEEENDEQEIFAGAVNG